jgi:hypothetical protein
MAPTANVLHRPAFRPVARSDKDLSKTEQQIEKIVHQAVYEEHPVGFPTVTGEIPMSRLCPNGRRNFVAARMIDLYQRGEMGPPLSKPMVIPDDHPLRDHKGAQHFERLGDLPFTAMIKSFPPEVKLAFAQTNRRHYALVHQEGVWTDQLTADHGKEYAVGGKESFKELNRLLPIKNEMTEYAKKLTNDGAAVAEALIRRDRFAAEASGTKHQYFTDLVKDQGEAMLEYRPQQLKEFRAVVDEGARLKVAPVPLFSLAAEEFFRNPDADHDSIAAFEKHCEVVGNAQFHDQPEKMERYREEMRRFIAVSFDV